MSSAKTKHSKRMKLDHALTVPSYIFKDRSVSVLETIVHFLKEKEDLTYHEIAELLNRDDRTIWTVHHRVKKKRGARQ